MVLAEVNQVTSFVMIEVAGSVDISKVEACDWKGLIGGVVTFVAGD